MVHLLQEKHKISLTVSTLKRRLATYRLSRKNSNPNEQEVKSIIRKESQGSGHLSGYRKMWHILRINYHMHVPRSLVAKSLREIDPESSQLRKKRKLKRRQYISEGPNQCWHIDGNKI